LLRTRLLYLGIHTAELLIPSPLWNDLSTAIRRRKLEIGRKILRALVEICQPAILCHEKDDYLHRLGSGIGFCEDGIYGQRTAPVPERGSLFRRFHRCHPQSPEAPAASRRLSSKIMRS
jgi:hypothetical protein